MDGSRVRRVHALLAAAALTPIVVLNWLGLRVFEQERELERAAAGQALEVAAGRLAIAVDRQLQDVEARLTRGDGIVFSAAGLSAPPELTPLYQPFLAASPEPAVSTFAEGEIAEFQKSDPAAAAGVYRRLAASRDAAIRAGALVRLGRVLRKRGDRDGALKAYADLESVRGIGYRFDLEDVTE